MAKAPQRKLDKARFYELGIITGTGVVALYDQMFDTLEFRKGDSEGKFLMALTVQQLERLLVDAKSRATEVANGESTDKAARGA